MAKLYFPFKEMVMLAYPKTLGPMETHGPMEILGPMEVLGQMVCILVSKTKNFSLCLRWTHFPVFLLEFLPKILIPVIFQLQTQINLFLLLTPWWKVILFKNLQSMFVVFLFQVSFWSWLIISTSEMLNSLMSYIILCFEDENRPSLFANVDIASPILEEPEDVIVCISWSFDAPLLA